jgi:hypothetical protein
MDFDIRIPVADLADQIYWNDEEDVIELIKRIDKRWAECDFTVRLLNHFADALRGEGYTINLEIKEP